MTFVWAESAGCHGYSRIWQRVPCHPGAQRQALALTHSPPFKHSCKQLAGRQRSEVSGQALSPWRLVQMKEAEQMFPQGSMG